MRGGARKKGTPATASAATGPTILSFRAEAFWSCGSLTRALFPLGGEEEVEARAVVYSERPAAAAKGLISAMSCLKTAGFRDCTPSDMASSGLGCPSTIRPSAPQAMEPGAMTVTYFQWPVPWLGSTRTGGGGRALRT